jgi:expansin (peptidoglycan-binding protein)
VALTGLTGLTAGCQITPGTTYQGDGTYYQGDGSGNCGFPAGATVLYAAMNETDYENSRTCGAYVEATGPKGTVTVEIVDRCPECASGDLDFSPQAFGHIADLPDGRVPISWKVVSAPAAVGPIQIVVKDGSNPWWIAFQVRQHANIVTSLEVQVGGQWQALERQQYNYFLASSGLGSGPFTIRLTDVYGQQLVQSGITLSPTVVQPTSLQFSRH